MSSRDIALNINNVQLIAQPILVSLTKVNLYGIPNASQDEIIKPIGEALSAFGKLAQIRAYLLPDVHAFDGQTTVLLGTRSININHIVDKFILVMILIVLLKQDGKTCLLFVDTVIREERLYFAR